MRDPSRRSVALGLAAAGCRLHLPDPPVLPQWSWEIDRSTLPDVTVRALVVATVQMTARQTVAFDHDKTPHTAPIAAYVLEHPTRGLWVIDSGYGHRTEVDPTDYPGKTATKVLKLEMKGTLAERLPDIGRRAEDVQGVLVTHLHHDHAGGIEDLPNAVVWSDEREWYAAQRKRFIAGYDPVPYAGREHRSFPFVGSPPYGPFPASADFFGDGSLIALPAPGHTIGSVCYLINRPTRSYLITGDAAWVDRNWQGPLPVGYLPATVLAWDWKRAWDQLWRIKEWASRFPDLVVIAGHEPANLERLPAWPGTLG